MTVSNISTINILKADLAIVNEPNKAYKDLNKFEKLAIIQDYHFMKSERHYVAIYVKALWLNQTDILNEYESLGNSPGQFLDNKRVVEQLKKFGHTEFKRNEHGWIIEPPLLDYEKFKFYATKQVCCFNHVRIGRSPSNHWFYAVSYSTGAGGGSGPLSVWATPFNTREEALNTGLNELLNNHTEAFISYKGKSDGCGNYNPKYSNEIIKLVKDKINEKHYGIQQSLF